MKLKKVRKDRMFDFVTESWNPLTGCLHNCYNGKCWARLMTIRFSKKWGYDFRPKFHPERLKRKFKPNTLVFVCSMGDMFGNWVKDEWILKIFKVIQANPQTTFFLQTKNTMKMWLYQYNLTPNVIISTTLETNREYNVSKAPPPWDRYYWFKRIKHKRKHVSIEPIMDFDFDEFLYMIKEIKPEAVSIGYDNYGANLPEPPLLKTQSFIQELRKFTEVHIKGLRK